MWTIMKWAVGLNLAASASALTDKFQDNRVEIGLGALLFALISAAFITYFHCGIIRQRRKLERMKKYLGEKSDEFRALEGKPEPSRLSRWKDWTIGAFQILLIVATGIAASLIAFGVDLDLWCLVLAAISVSATAIGIASLAVALWHIPNYTED